MSIQYTAFGLVFNSELEFPEFQLTTAEVADVTIRVDTIPDRLETITGEGVLYQLNSTQFRLDVPGIAQYFVENGESITAQPHSPIDNASVRLFLLGPVFAALLYQRTVLVLHASSIETPKGAVLFCGQSGVGKSTTAAALRQRGYKVVSDDISVVEMKDGSLSIVPGYPQQTLWANALHRLGIQIDGLERVRPQLEKYCIPLQESFCSSTQPIYRIYILSAANNLSELDIQPISGLNKLTPLANQSYRRQFLTQMGKGKHHTMLLAELSRQAQMFFATRPNALDQLDILVDMLEQDINT